jgi:hypothetical protein
VLLRAKRFYDHRVQDEADAVGFDSLRAFPSATVGRRVDARDAGEIHKILLCKPFRRLLP